MSNTKLCKARLWQDLRQFCDDLIEYHWGNDDMIAEVKAFKEDIGKLILGVREDNA